MPTGVSYPLNTFQPMGLGYIAGVLLKNNYQVKIFDVLAEGYNHEEIIESGKYRYVGLPMKDVRKRIKTFSPDMIGITAPFTSQAKAVHEMAKLIKHINPKIKVVIGGSYPTTYSDMIFDDKNFDFIVKGEGELTLLELVKKIEKKDKRFNTIKGLIFRENNKIIINKPRPLLMGLDNYSVAWELLPMAQYFEAAYNIKSSRSTSTFGKRWATIFTSRGCPFSCAFCAGRLVMGQIWRARSVKNVIDEMEFLIKRYQIQHFDIEDDNFTFNKQRAKEICKEIIRKGWKIKWSTPNGIRADTVDEELIKYMKQAGCVRTIVAPESGNQWVVDNLMNKKINLNHVKKVVKWCRKYNLLVDAFFLIGMPGETEKQIEDTIKYAHELKKIGVNDCGFSVLVPHRGTEAYKIAAEKGWLLNSNTDNFITGLSTGEPMVETPYLSVDKLKELFKKARRVNPMIPYGQFRLAFLMMIRSPKRFVKLTISYISKLLGFSEGLLGT